MLTSFFVACLIGSLAGMGYGLGAMGSIGNEIRDSRQESEIAQSRAELEQARAREAELDARLRQLEAAQAR